MPKILALYYDPVFEGVKQSARYNWVEPRAGLELALSQLNGAMVGSGLSYTMDLQEITSPAHTKRSYQSHHVDLVDSSPPAYLPTEQWIANWNLYAFAPDKWPGGGEIHIKEFLRANNIVAKINSGEIDEVWTGGGPIPACFEGCMLAPEGDTEAYGSHDTLIYVPGLQRRVVWHMFSTENWNPLHNYFHRIESIMAWIWSPRRDSALYGIGYAEQWSSYRDLMSIYSYWQWFCMTENELPGEGQLGSCHFPVNAKLGYVTNMEDVVPSGHKLWLNYPSGFPMDLSRNDRFDMVSVEDWKDKPDYVWQYEHIPRGPGVFDGRYVNWWRYIVDVNESYGRGAPISKPWTGQPRPYATTVVRYGDQVCIRWQNHDGDPSDARYDLLVDDRLIGTLPRRAPEHTRFSYATPLARSSYAIRMQGEGGWESKWTSPNPNIPWLDDTVPPIPPPIPGVVMLTISQAQAAIHELHGTLARLAGFPEPSGYEEYAANIYPYWLTTAHGKIIMSLQKIWTTTIVKQVYPLMYRFEQLRDGVIDNEPPPPPPPPGQLTITQVTQMVNILHTLPELANCPKPTYTLDPATFDILLHWPGVPSMLIDKNWTILQVNSYYKGMYPKALCGGVVPPIDPPPPGTGFDVRPLVDTMITGQEALLVAWRAFRAKL